MKNKIICFTNPTGHNSGLAGSLSKAGLCLENNTGIDKIKEALLGAKGPFCALCDMEIGGISGILTDLAGVLDAGMIIKIINDNTPYHDAKNMAGCCRGQSFSFPSETAGLISYLSSFCCNDENDLNFFHGIIGKSGAFKSIKEFIIKTAGSNLPVMIEGESGTGKELIAKAIFAESGLKKGNFVAVNCGALPKDLVENELFGHDAGAFSGAASKKRGLFEEADNGILFIDEIGEMDYGSQSKLLRVLETGAFRRLGGTEEIKVNVRVLAATNKILENEVQKGTFRLDLFYRLCVLRLFVKPLRERPEDIVDLAEYFVRKSLPGAKISSGFIEAIKNYSWPGNIRELKNAVDRAIVMSEGQLDESTLPEYVRGLKKETEVLSGGLKEFTCNTEKEFIIRALGKFDNNKTLAANALGITRYQLYRKMEKYGV